MVVVALPVWLIILLCVGLLLLLVGGLYGLTVFTQQLLRNNVTFEGTLPVDEIPPPSTDNPRYSPRLRGVSEQMADELRHQVEEDLGPR